VDDGRKIVKKLLVIFKIWSWLPLGWINGTVAAKNIFLSVNAIPAVLLVTSNN